ncbi:cytochrome c oxidase subunit 4 [Thalassiella azotivora]
MRITTAVFAGLTLFFLPVGIVYGWLTKFDEPVGFAALLLTGGMAGMVAVYTWMTTQRLETLSGDQPDAVIEDDAGEQGFFSPHSWWPLPLAFGASLVFLGVAIGWWIFFIGIGFSAVALIGWVYEYYRGAHAH